MMNDIKKLQDQIEFLRRKMNDTALEKGVSDEQTIMISQELDKLINHYQRFSLHIKDVIKRD